jgi:hypothetical protein
MCTLSVFKNNDGTLTITMNRDERHERDELGTLRATDHACYPVDPISNGTWIGLNAHGLTFALLNRYQDPHEDTNSQSRGQIIPALLNAKTLEDAEQRIRTYPYAATNPFDLIAIDARAIITASWNAKDLTITKASTAKPFFITSSSIKTQEIITHRQTLFNAFSNQDTYTPDHIIHNLHLKRGAENDEASIFMNRPKTHTKSLTQITLNTTQTLRYWPTHHLESYRANPIAPSDWQQRAITHHQTQAPK